MVMNVALAFLGSWSVLFVGIVVLAVALSRGPKSPREESHSCLVQANPQARGLLTAIPVEPNQTTRTSIAYSMPWTPRNEAIASLAVSFGLLAWAFVSDWMTIGAFGFHAGFGLSHADYGGYGSEGRGGYDSNISGTLSAVSTLMTIALVATGSALFTFILARQSHVAAGSELVPGLCRLAAFVGAISAILAPLLVFEAIADAATTASHTTSAFGMGDSGGQAVLSAVSPGGACFAALLAGMFALVAGALRWTRAVQAHDALQTPGGDT